VFSETLMRGTGVGVEVGSIVLVGVAACVFVGDGGADVSVAKMVGVGDSA
jgi:hypothetical protein